MTAVRTHQPVFRIVDDDQPPSDAAIAALARLLIDFVQAEERLTPQTLDGARTGRAPTMDGQDRMHLPPFSEN